MIKTIIIAALAISATRQDCVIGCLKCSSKGDCLIPDIRNLYYLNGTTATKTTLTNCALNNISGTCAFCSAGYYLDSATSKCVANPTTGITNCAVYSSATSCSACNQNYYLSTNACVAVTSSVPNCDIYGSASTCAVCAKNYILSLNYLSCVSAPSISNCGDFTFVNCKTCSSGYVLNPNNYLSSALVAASSADQTALASFVYSVSDNNSQGIAQNACQVQSTANCALFNQSTNTCITCSSGYYLDAKTVACVVFPDEPIANCQKYTAVNVCSVCVAGFYFLNGVCTQIAGTAIIANCATYYGDLATTTVQCSACTANYYLSSNTCVARVKSLNNTIANCATSNVAADNCYACSTGYVLASDFLYCFAAIANCQTHAPTATGAAITCSTCNSGFYATTAVANASNACTPGSVAGCSTYPVASPSSCSLCQNKYYAVNYPTATCTAQPNISNCSTYSTTLAMYCLVCNNPGYFNFSLQKYCQNIPSASLISNCTSYSGDITNVTCATCAIGYYVKNNACVSTGSNLCLALDANNKCSSCSAGYAVALDGSGCLAPLTFVTDNCLTNSTVDASNSENVKDVTANVCVNGAIPFNMNNYYVCISITEAAQYSASIAAISGCIKYSSTGACVQCDVESTTPYLETTGVCTATCATGAYRKLVYGQVDSNSVNSYNITQMNVCVTVANNTVTGCQVYGPDLTTDGTFICIMCNSLNLNILSPAETKYSNVNPSATSSTSFIPSAFAKFPSVTCNLLTLVQKLGGIAISNGVNTINECAYYFAPSANDYSCLKCNMGYVGVMNSGNFVNACTREINCSTSTYYNLDAAINNLASCHTCSNNAIPFIAYQSSTVKLPSFASFAKYTFTFSTNFLSVGSEVNTISCKPNVAATFTSLTNAYNIDANCGMAVLIVNSNSTFADTDTAANNSYGLFCAACLPGYKPTGLSNFAAAYPYVKKACTQIANCAANTTYFNACSACSASYILAFASSNIDFTTCLSIDATKTALFNNCHAAIAVGATTVADKCQICKQGYFLNVDNVCESYQPINCQVGGFVPIQTKTNATTVDWSLALNGTSVGCNKCSAGIAYAMIASKLTCIKSSWVSNSVNTPTIDTVFVKFCQNYTVDATRICKTCAASYVISGGLVGAVPTANGLACHPNSGLANCAIASSASACIQCINSTFILRSGSCTLGAIANCLNYDYKNINTSTCVDCAPNYYLSNNTCVLGQVYNCKRLTDNNNGMRCTTCQPGYALISVANSNDYCYPQDASLGCKDMTITSDSTYGGKINCTTCTNAATQAIGSVPASSNNTFCMAHYLISNCATYNIGANINSSNFRCTACNSGFYLATVTNSCVARINQPGKCTLYTVDTDTCTTCDNTSYLNAGLTACIDYPSGILGCTTYSNATTCTACKAGLYLSANACPQVTTAIANCLYYSSNTSCSLCKANFALISGACVSATATNCATYTSASICATCPVGYVLQTTNAVTSCIAKAIVGCVTINVNTPYDCLLCAGNYYLSAGTCNIPTLITNCAAYDSKTTCSQCNPGYALSIDKASCVNTVPTVNYVDSQCVDSQISSTPVCSRCGAGFYFVNGACTGSCNSGNTSGCLACNPASATTCYVCKPGFYQTMNGVCNSAAAPSSVTLVKGVFTVLLALVVLMF